MYVYAYVCSSLYGEDIKPTKAEAVMMLDLVDLAYAR